MPRRRIACLIFLVFLAGCQSQPTRSPHVQNLEASASAGDADAQFALGAAYDFGNGVKPNGTLAEHWYSKAAEQGHAEAQNSLGSGYLAEEKYPEALVWYQKAAAQNHPMAINSLAYMYDLGLGVPQDRSRAHALYVKSANLGEPEAMWNLANMYGAGQIGEEDVYQACIWTFRAKKFTNQSRVALNKNMQGVFPYLKDSLSSEQYTSCQQEANKWSPKELEG